MATTPTFGKVTKVIQLALSKVNKGANLTPGSIPSNFEMFINAINHCRQTKRYGPPHKRTVDGANQNNSGKFSVEKATFYRGKGHTNSLKERYGYNCLYCGIRDHWYSDCNSFWEDVRHGRIAALPPNHDERGSKYTPPPCTTEQHPQHPHPAQTHQYNGCMQKINVPEANDGTVLLDSGSTINVSGKSRFFTITSKLASPLTVLLAISKFVALLVPLVKLGF
jgi:hypothetical protein